MSSDELDLFVNMAECPACGCIDYKGSFRCLGCGAFHSTAHLVEREAPLPEQRISDEILLDPRAYSMGPNQKIIEEEFEQSKDVVSWQGGSTDFKFTDESSHEGDEIDIPAPEPEEL
ncbi:MAG: hypothetical protein VXW28_04580 [Candidatus Thermoplasmatota archaeon]|nr:hypothetical protein [Candidatus Thermoplasmatota archaeon]